MSSYNTRSKGTKSILPDTQMRTSPEPLDSDNPSLNAVEENQTVSSKREHHHHSEPLKTAIKQSSAAIHHHIPPAFGAPFLQADGLVHRGHLVHRYTDGTESPVPVELKSLGDGTVITRIVPLTFPLMENRLTTRLRMIPIPLNEYPSTQVNLPPRKSNM